MYLYPMECSVFRPFGESVVVNALAEGITFSLEGDDVPHPLCLLAVNRLQLHLQHERAWEHNFGLSSGEGTVIGKMFGVLVVRTKEGELGYISAFSGKLAGGNHHPEFVPPVFDGLVEGGFVNEGMRELTRINEEISATNNHAHINQLKIKRKNHSVALQQRIFEQYHFLNKAGESKSLMEIFDNKPPAGAGECAAPKLLQYAFLHSMEPLALAEFWWGLSPKSDNWKHGHFYPPCREKCASILKHMLA